jgi:hypothetical protein
MQKKTNGSKIGLLMYIEIVKKSKHHEVRFIKADKFIWSGVLKLCNGEYTPTVDS